MRWHSYDLLSNSLNPGYRGGSLTNSSLNRHINTHEWAHSGSRASVSGLHTAILVFSYMRISTKQPRRSKRKRQSPKPRYVTSEWFSRVILVYIIRPAFRQRRSCGLQSVLKSRSIMYQASKVLYSTSGLSRPRRNDSSSSWQWYIFREKSDKSRYLPKRHKNLGKYKDQ